MKHLNYTWDEAEEGHKRTVELVKKGFFMNYLLRKWLVFKIWLKVKLIKE